MLGKLIKHEFRATGRVMGPIFLALMASAVMANFSSRVLDAVDNKVLNILGVLFLVVFVVALIGAAVMALVVMVQRFNKNLLGDQGYLMFTLPVSVHSLIFSKIIVSSVWFILTGIAEALAVLIASFRVDYVTGFASFIKELFSSITSYYALHGAAIFAETVVVIFLACAASCLMFYAAMSVGYSFSNHKVLLSVVFYFVMYFTVQFIGVTGLVAANVPTMDIEVSAMTAIHMVMGIAVACELVYCAVFYFITATMLKKRLNLG